MKLTWVAGHANIGGNESADALAKEGAIKATTDPDIRSMTMVSCSEEVEDTVEAPKHRPIIPRNHRSTPQAETNPLPKH